MWKSGAPGAGKVCEVEKTVRFCRNAACLTSHPPADTVLNLEKGRLKFLYPNPMPNRTEPMKTPVPILVVDDNPRNLAVIDSVLESPEYQLVLVQTAQDALQALLCMEFAAVLLDVKMPVVSGYELARLIKGRKLSRHLPIIFISAHRTDVSDARVGYTAGGADYVCKPFDPYVLRAKVEVFAELYREHAELTLEANTLRVENARLQQVLTTQIRTH